MVLAVLSATLKCQWELTSADEAAITMVTTVHTILILFNYFITQVVFVGFLLGGPVWGVTADKFGRKKVCAQCTVVCVVCICFCTGPAGHFNCGIPVWHGQCLLTKLLCVVAVQRNCRVCYWRRIYWVRYEVSLLTLAWNVILKWHLMQLEVCLVIIQK